MVLGWGEGEMWTLRRNLRGLIGYYVGAVETLYARLHEAAFSPDDDLSDKNPSGPDWDLLERRCT